MSEIKPVYQTKTDNKWIDIAKEDLTLASMFGVNRILYPAAAYEALQKEKADLQLRLDAKTLSHQLMLDRTLGLQKENAELKKSYAKELDIVSNRNYELRIDNEALKAELELAKMMSVGYIAKGDRLYDENEALKAESAEQAKRIAELEKPLTTVQIASVCLSYRHDFGLLEPEQQQYLMSTARTWESCFQKERDIAASNNGDSK